MVNEDRMNKMARSSMQTVVEARKLAMTLEKVKKIEDLSENTLISLCDIHESAEKAQNYAYDAQKKRDEYKGYWEKQRAEVRRLSECLDTINTLRKMIHYDE